MFLFSASFHATVSRLIFCFVAFRAGEPPGRPRNSTYAAYWIVNIFIFNVGHCAQSAVGGREHSLYAGHSSIDPGAETTNVYLAKIPHFTHKWWSAFFGWGTTRNRFSMTCLFNATCSLSGHVASAAVGKGLTSTVILPMSMLRRVALSICVPAAAASFSAARVVLLVLPTPQPQLMVVRCVLFGL